MRIAYVTAHYPPELGAASTRSAGMTSALAERGHEVHVFTLVPSYPWGRIVGGYRNGLCRTTHEGRLVVHRFWTAAAKPSRLLWRQLSYLPSVGLTVVYGRSIVRRGRFDVVICSIPPPLYGLAGLGLHVCSRAPLVLEVRDPWPDSLEIAGHGPRLKLAAAGLRRLLTPLHRRASLAVVVSPGLTRRLEDSYGLGPEKLAVIPGAVSEALLDENLRKRAMVRAEHLRASWGLAGRKVVGYAGILGLAQNLDVVLKAAEMMPPDVVVLLVGEGSVKVDLERVIRTRGLQHVQIRPPVETPEDLMAVYYVFDLALVSLGKTELYHAALPIKAMELACLGRPLLVADYTQLREFLRNYDSATFYEPGSAESLARGVSRYFEAPAPPEPATGRRMEYQLTWEVRARMLEEALSRIVPGTSPTAGGGASDA